MTLINTAKNLKVGTQQVVNVYAGEVKVWPTVLDPTTISGLTIWVDASQLALADGADVMSWPDLSGGGRGLAPLTAYKPKFKANEQNGLGVVRFGGVNQEHLTTSVIGTYRHFFIVAKYRLATFANYNGVLTSDSDLALVGGGPGAVDWYNYTQDEYRKNGSVRVPMSGPMAAWAHMGITKAAGWINWMLWIGIDRGFADRQWDGDVAEVLGYDRVLSETERLQVENYLKTKWGL